MKKSEIAQHAREIAVWLETAPEEYNGGFWMWIDAEGEKHG